MCRAKHKGGRRCPHCGSYAAVAKANGNRRAAREARRAVVEHLTALGLTQTAAAVLAAPPSTLTEFLAGAHLDPALVDSIKLPSTHSGAPSAAHLLQTLAAERAAQAPSQLTPQQIAAADATSAVAAAKAALAAATNTTDRQNAKTALQEARQDLAAARLDLALSQVKRDATRDTRYAALTEKQAEDIAAARTRRISAHVDQAFAAVGVPALAAGTRDTSIYQAATITIDLGGDTGTQTVEARELDGGTAIYRRGYSDFLILQRFTPDGPYAVVSAASSKQAAVDKANRIPLVAVLPAPPNADPTVAHAHRAVVEAGLSVARAAADGKTITPTAFHSLVQGVINAERAKQAVLLGGDAFLADRFAALSRHLYRLRQQKATAAATAAKKQALASGASAAQAAAAGKKAWLQAMGSPTRGGGFIPFFQHRIPPPGLGESRFQAVKRSGIISFGKETTTDYQVVKDRAGNIQAWGFSSSKTLSNINTLTSHAKPLLDQLKSHQRAAITTYTGGSYHAINAAFTGRDPHPHAQVATTVENLKSAFETIAAANKTPGVMTVMRGTRVPSAWTGSRSEYLDQVFTPGAKIEIGKVTSCTTRSSTAEAFTGTNPYLMVIRTRDGIPVKSLSQFSAEDEVIVPPGSVLRCVGVDHHAKYPTVYLVAEDLVAEADQHHSAAA